MDYDLRIKKAMAEAEEKAWEALAGYKFIMFGYHASRWVNYKNLLGEHRANPFFLMVDMAQKKVNSWSS
ncbi:unnamed protein product [marine sediment metagenome]|uniref:HEPN domain-containing protein n=1 Tax=marine sediment metagenome TaxID=412755 RepID=X1UCY5_9ZZZZ